MNIDTDTQWSFWDGIREYEAKNHDYLQQQIGNPDGADKPNKKYYDPRMALRAGEESMAKRLGEAMEDLNCTLFAQPAAAHTRTRTNAPNTSSHHAFVLLSLRAGINVL